MSDNKKEENRIRNIAKKFKEFDSIEVYSNMSSKRGLFLGVIFDLVILTRSSYSHGSSFVMTGTLNIMPCRMVLCEKYVRDKNEIQL